VDVGTGIAVDQDGNAYVVGNTESTDFPLVNPLRSSPETGFLTKLNASGTALTYSTYFGAANDIAVDTAGNAYLTADPGVVKINTRGTAIVYAIQLPADVRGIAVDGLGNAYVTGETFSRDFPLKNAFQSTFSGETAFVTEVSSDGSGLVYSTYLGGQKGAQGLSIAVDSLGSAYVAGNTVSTDFPTTPGAWQTTFKGDPDCSFVTRFAVGGESLIYSTYLQGFSTLGNRIAVDKEGNAYITGILRTNAYLFPTPFPLPPIAGDSGDGFVAKLNPTGSALLDTYYLQGRKPPGNPYVFGHGIAADSNGDVYVVGETGALDFPTVNAIQPALNANTEDAFITKIDMTTNSTDYFTGVIQELYQKFLNRVPDQTGMNNDLFFLTHHLGTEEDIEAEIIGSVEYYSIRAGGTLQGFESAVYSDLFNRAIDPVGKSNIELALLNQFFTREQVVRMNINHTYEYDYDLVLTLYQELLGRSASQAEVNNWLVYLRDHTDQEAIEFIIHTPEYLQPL
jgi:hypothetical protein